MNKQRFGIMLLLTIIFWQFGNWLINAILNPSWLSFPTPIIVALGIVTYGVAVVLIIKVWF